MKKLDVIKVDNLLVFGNHGVFKEENVLGQKFYVSVALYLECRQAGLTDDLDLSVNYGKVCEQIHEFFKDHTYKLIEACAEHLAAELLMAFPLVLKLDLTVSKPWAPIGLPVDNVSVTIHRGWKKAYIALGSNMGDKLATLKDAVEKIDNLSSCRVKRVSDYIVTKPYGGVEQDDFVNGAMEIETLLEPEELLMVLHSIEAEAGRERKIHWGPRTLDLDILFYEEEIMSTPDLTIPHVDMQNRDFVLKPMAQIAPYFIHPVLHKSMTQLLQELGM